MTPLRGLDVHVASWLDEGLIDHEAAERILRAEARLTADEGRHSPLVVEAVGYVGGVLVGLGAVLIAAQMWNDWSAGTRLGLVGVGVGVLLVAGAAVPARVRTTAARLRAVLWLLASGAASLWLGLVATQVLHLEGLDVGLLVTGGTLGLASGLWRFSRHPLQHGAAFLLLAGFVATSVAEVAPNGRTGDVLPGVGLLVLGVAWLGLGLSGLLAPRVLAVLLGGAGVVGGASVLVPTSWGRFVAVAAVAALLAVGATRDELALLGVGTVGLLVILPPVLMTWFAGVVAAPVVLLVGGGAVVLVALRLLGRSRT